MKSFDYFIFIFILLTIIWLGYYEKQMQIKDKEYKQFAELMNSIYRS